MAARAVEGLNVTPQSNNHPQKNMQTSAIHHQHPTSKSPKKWTYAGRVIIGTCGSRAFWNVWLKEFWNVWLKGDVERVASRAFWNVTIWHVALWLTVGEREACG
jgi:hypothetical protein